MLSLWLAAMVAGATGAEQKLILYFDPDGNHKAIAEITKLFNQYLAREKVPLTFQAVGHFEELQKQLRSGKAELAIVHSDFLRATQGLTPLLVPAWKGEPFYTKVLIDSGRGEPKRLAGSIIYATKSHGDRRLAEIAVLAMLRRANVDVAGARVVFVSKDIDGVLGVVFSQA